MLKITKIADYGFRLLIHMAAQEEGLLYNAKDLSASIDIPLPTVSKVLKILTQGNVLVSHQGSKGGYALARSASQISVAQVLEAVDGPVAITDCNTTEGCERNCQASSSWKKINHAMNDLLEGLTLADMASE